MDPESRIKVFYLVGSVVLGTGWILYYLDFLDVGNIDIVLLLIFTTVFVILFLKHPPGSSKDRDSYRHKTENIKAHQEGDKAF